MALSVRWAKRHPDYVAAAVRAELRDAEAVQRHRLGAAMLSLATVLFGLGMVALSSDLLIGSAVELARRMDVPNDIVAVTLVALGTSLPELATGIASVLKGHPELMVGNVIGADILNVLLVTGLSATARPLRVAPTFFYLHLPTMLVTVVLLGVYIFTSRQRFRRRQGLPLLAVYAAYCALLAFWVGRR
jgi:cation:H+ antiporter